MPFVKKEEGNTCWRCGYNFATGSICPMCGAVNKLAEFFPISQSVNPGTPFSMETSTSTESILAVGILFLHTNYRIQYCYDCMSQGSSKIWYCFPTLVTLRGSNDSYLRLSSSVCLPLRRLLVPSHPWNGTSLSFSQPYNTFLLAFTFLVFTGFIGMHTIHSGLTIPLQPSSYQPSQPHPERPSRMT